MEPDTTHSLASIRDNCQTPLFWNLLEIQKHKSMQKNSLEWIRSLQCLYRIDSDKPSRKRRRKDQSSCIAGQKEILLGRQIINPLNDSERNYVVVSYTWHPSSKSNEAATVGRYHIQSRDKQASIPSAVRDIVLDRVIKYVEYCKSDLFWIDKECIDQADSDKKEIAMQSMDQVYSLSNFPVGLLSTCIESEDHMELLVELLHGELVMDGEEASPPKLQPWLSPARAWKALELIDRLTSDNWWSRAWIFQEDYRSSIRMVLLIPHCPSLEYRKRDTCEILGSLAGELCVSSANFREEATKFCIAYKKGGKNRRNIDICNRILQTAGKYSILLREPNDNGDNIVCKSMSPLILADIGKRGITESSDLLAIAANCCGYPNRLITTRLATMKCSLSLSILTLYLLNGEIIWNNARNGTSALYDNIFDFLKKQSLDNFNPPVAKRELMFMKMCRLPNVKLLQEGIKTTGQLWKLGKVIETRKFPHKLPRERSSAGGLSLYQRRRLRQLSNELALGKHGKSYMTLAKDIDQYLCKDADLANDRDLEVDHAREYKDLMIKMLVQAIKNGKKLRLACLADIKPKGQVKAAYSPYRGIFVTEFDEMSEEKRPSYVFTASEKLGHIEKFVSLEVNRDASITRGLIIKRWVNGLCFSDSYPLVDVVFAWPVSLAS